VTIPHFDRRHEEFRSGPAERINNPGKPEPFAIRIEFGGKIPSAPRVPMTV
jgi:hypothetical protein